MTVQDKAPASPRYILATPLELPCGVVLKNRIAKSAMSDSLGDGTGNATLAQARLYERWAEGGAALAFIGEVQFTPSHPEKLRCRVRFPGLPTLNLLFLPIGPRRHALFGA